MIDTLGSENVLLSQRLADLERAVASMAQNVPVPPDESHESQNPTDPGSSGLNDVGRDLQVGSQAPQVQEASDATREQYPPKDAALGASGSSSSDPKVAPRAPVGFPKSFAPPQPDIKSDAKRVQIQDGDPRAQPQGPPEVARTQDVRGPVDVQAQMSSLPTHPQNPAPRVTLMNGGQGQGTQAADASGGDAATSASDPASHEETVVRIKDLKDLVLPLPPENAGQARGYVNQVVMAIGRLQKTTGDELYLWAQDCLTSSEERLRADKRFPRATREIAAKLLKTCCKGKFGLLFQNMVEHERNTAGTMPDGRVMLRSIFKHFQLERDRIGILGERNLLGLKLAGQSVADIEAFREKYNYILRAIPLDELPKERTLFNHLIDEFVEKARESAHDSHRRTCAWLWAKADLAIELAQQKRNRDEFDQDVKLKPAVRGTGKEAAGEEEEQERREERGSRAG